MEAKIYKVDSFGVISDDPEPFTSIGKIIITTEQGQVTVLASGRIEVEPM